jgi:hypothetical protein
VKGVLSFAEVEKLPGKSEGRKAEQNKTKQGCGIKVVIVVYAIGCTP